MRRTLVGLVAGGALVTGSLTAPAASATVSPAPLSPALSRTMATAPDDPTTVMVHGATLADAEQAVADTGMVRVTSFDRIGVVVARALPPQVETARTLPGVSYLEGDQPLQLFTSTSHEATRGTEARETLTGADGGALDGAGVSIAVIDSGIDPTHPAFAGGKVVRNLRAVCLMESNIDTGCVVDVPPGTDTDTSSVGGHGTHVNGIAAGNALTLTDGTEVSGAAPGATLVSISTGAALVIIGADTALNWVLENHADPCSGCPPIKVVNNSYGPAGGGELDENSATVKLQRALADDGVVTVWAAGNDAGDGTETLTNPPGQDPTGGILSVASYFDEDSGTRDGVVSEYSSRGVETDPSTWPDLSAPGEEIVSACRPYLLVCSTGTTPQNGPGPLDLATYNTISGTSMAAPHISGIVAQLFQADPDASPAEVEEALKSTAHRYTDGEPYVDVDGYETSFDKGAGLVDVVAAAEALGAAGE
ncbi:S8 family serine peptidase [Pseudonocardia saturnea]